MLDLTGKRVFVAGHAGLVGSALCRALAGEGCEVLTIARAQLDLRDQSATHDWLAAHKPDAVIVAAGMVGGIGANIAAPASFLYDNAAIAAHVIHGSYLAGVRKLLFLGSSCMYPKEAALPLREETLLSGAFEPTNAPYALAKCFGVQLCRTYRQSYGCDFISAIPCNLYGANDRYETDRSHVIAALIMRAHAAKQAGDARLSIWGSGRPLREFLHADDAARALLLLLKHYSDDLPVNVGSGVELSIAALAEVICDIVGFKGALVFDESKPDGVYSKIMDGLRMKALGWQAEIELRAGLAQAYQDYLQRFGDGS